MTARAEQAAGFLEQALERAGAPLEGADDLRRDADALGLVGLLSALAGPLAPLSAPEQAETEQALAAALELPGPPASAEAWSPGLEQAATRLGAGVAADRAAEALHRAWALDQHELVPADLRRVLDLLARVGPGQDARGAARALARLSRRAARHVLGHLPDQLDLILRLGNLPEGAPVPWGEVDARLEEFAPRVFAQRLPSLLRVLLGEEARLRLAFVTWVRLRGRVLPREALLRIPGRIVPERPQALLAELGGEAEARGLLREAARPGLADALERLHLAAGTS